MKMNLQMRTLYKGLAITALASVLGNSAQAQLVDDNVFLKGKYVEVGIAPIGAFGSSVIAPEGYHPRLWSGSTGAAQLGFVSDPDMDGWDVGTPNYVGCYFLPGDPQEGWDVQIDGVWNRAWRGAAGGGTGTTFSGAPVTLTGENISHSVSGSKVIGVWEGSMGNLQIRQTTELDTNKVYFIVKVDLKNTGSTPLEDIYYNRTVDADQESSTPGGGGSSTVNSIEYQPDPSATTEDGMKCLVSATGPMLGDIAYLGLGAVDCRAKCYIVGGYSLNPSTYDGTTLDKIFEETAPGDPAYIYGKDESRTADVGMGLLFNIGTLLPGDSTSLAYAYILRVQDLDSAFNSLTPSWLLDGSQFTSGDTLKKCWGADVEVNIQGGGAYVWGEWVDLNGGPTLPAGRNNLVQMDHTPLTYRVVGTNPICPLSDTLIMTFIPEGDSVILNERRCAGEVYDFMGDLKYQTGTYVNMRKTSIGCDSIVVLNLTIDPLPEIELSARETEICEGEEALLFLSAPSSYANYQWSRNGYPIPGATQHSYAASEPGVYSISGISDKGCDATSRNIEVVVNPAASGAIVSISEQDVCIGDTVTLKSDAKPNYQYSWSPESFFRYTGGSLNTEATGIIPGTSEVYLMSMNEYGCKDFDTAVVQAHPCCDIYIPTAFTPNNDGLNDYFLPALRPGQVIVALQIFSRNGQMVYDNNEPLKGWNGQMNNSGELLPQAVYMYRFIYTCTDGEVYETKGDLTVVR